MLTIFFKYNFVHVMLFYIQKYCETLVFLLKVIRQTFTPGKVSKKTGLNLK